MSLNWNPSIFSTLNLIKLHPVKILDSFTLSLITAGLCTKTLHTKGSHQALGKGKGKSWTQVVCHWEKWEWENCALCSVICLGTALYLVERTKYYISQSSRGSKLLKYWMDFISDFHSECGIHREQIRILIWNYSQM